MLVNHTTHTLVINTCTLSTDELRNVLTYPKPYNWVHKYTIIITSIFRLQILYIKKKELFWKLISQREEDKSFTTVWTIPVETIHTIADWAIAHGITINTSVEHRCATFSYTCPIYKYKVISFTDENSISLKTCNQ